MIEWLRSASEVGPSGRGFGGSVSRFRLVVSRNLRCRGEDFRRSVVAGTSRSSRRAFGRRVDVFTRRVGISRSSRRLCTSGPP